MANTTRLAMPLLAVAQNDKELSLNTSLNLLDLNSAFLGILNNGNLGLGVVPTHRFHALEGITETWLTNTSNPTSGMKGVHINKTDKTSATSHGISYDVEGTSVAEQGVDFSTNVASKFGDFIPYFDPSCIANETQVATKGTNTAGQFRLTFSGQQTPTPGMTATTATGAIVQTALEGLSNIGAGKVAVVGNAGGPWEIKFIGTLGGAPQVLITMQDGTAPLTGGSGQGVTRIFPGATGADIIRVSPYVLGTGTQATKVVFAAPAGTPAADTEFVKIFAPKGLSGLSISANDDGGTLNLMTFVNRTVLNQRAIFNWQNSWLLGTDISGVGTKEFIFRDSVNSKTRLYLENTSALIAKMGWNTTSPIASIHSATSSDSSLYDVVQTPFAAGYSSLTNRAIQFQQIVDASQTTNYMWLMGTLGAGSTRVTPVTTSIGPTCHGIESTNAILSLISAPTGTNQAISRVVEIGDNKIGFFDLAVPVSRQTLAAAATDLATVITLANSLRTALNAYGLTT